MKTTIENSMKIPVEVFRVLIMISVLYVLGYLAACTNIQAQDEPVAAFPGDRLSAANAAFAPAATMVKRGYTNHRVWSIAVSLDVNYEAEFDLATLEKFKADKKPFIEVLYNETGLTGDFYGKSLQVGRVEKTSGTLIRWRFPQDHPDCRTAASLLETAKKMVQPDSRLTDPYLSIVK